MNIARFGREVPLADVQRAWDEAQVFLDPYTLDEVSIPSRASMRAPIAFVQNFPSHIHRAAAAMGFLSPRPTVPGLNERENGLLVIEELFCRHVERQYGRRGASKADAIRDAARVPSDDADPLGLLALVGNVPLWLAELADVLLGDETLHTVPLLPDPPVPDPFLHLSWSLWLLLPLTELVARGVPSDTVEQLRLENVGQPKNMQVRTAITVGMWGRVFTANEIASFSGQSLAAIRSYKKKDDSARGGRGKLLTSDIDGVTRRSQFELAFEVGHQRRNEATSIVCRLLGILPVEYFLYRDLWSQILERLWVWNAA